MKSRFQSIKHGFQITFYSVVVLLAGCQSKTSRSLTDGKANRPQAIERKYFDYKLENGMEGLVVPDSVLPKIHFTVIVGAGSKNDPTGRSGLAELTANLLETGSATLSSFELAEKFEFLGSELTIHTTKDRIVVSVDGLALYRDQLLDLLFSVVTEPRFEAREFTRVRSEMVSAIQKLPEQPTALASVAFDHLLYQGSPYDHPVGGTISNLQKVTLKDVLSFYRSTFQPCRTKLDIAGSVDEEFLARAKAKWSGWKTQCKELAPIQVDWKPTQRKIILVNSVGQKQTQIRFGHFGITSTAPDHLAVEVANAVLGQGFVSRLNSRVRDELGLTYSISSVFATARDRGNFSVTTFTRHEKTLESLREAEKVIADYAKSGPTSKELAAVKTLLVGQFPAGLQTAAQFADQLRVTRENGLPDSDLLEFTANVQAMPIAKVRAAAAEHLFPGKMLFTVLSDQSQVLPQLRELGEVEVIEAAKLFP